MNNGRPNYGNTPGWGNRQGQPNGYQQPPQPMGYQPQAGYQQPQGYPQPQGYQQPNTGYQPRQNQPYQQAYQQPYQQRFPQNYAQHTQPPQQGYQQGFGQQNWGYAQPSNQQRPGYQPITRQSQSPYMQGYQYPQGGQPQGYGYTQPMQRVPAKQPIKLETVAMVVLCGVLPVLFILGLIFPGLPVLKWIFVALAAASVALLWVKPVVASNVRLTFTGVYGALAIVALVSALTGTPPLDSTADINNGNQVTSQQSNTSVTTQNTVGSNALGNWTTDVPAAAPTTPPDTGLNNAAVEQLESFFYFWSVNNQDNMITLCAPSWQRSVSEPKKALFSILQNRVPVAGEYVMERISGTVNDTARTVTVTALIDKQNGRDPQKFRFQVIMKKENENWYVDPESLESNVVETTPVVRENITPVPPPAAEEGQPDMVLYYNKSGNGSKYHIDRECPSTDKKWLPFDGQFTFSQINEGDYASLAPCTRCGAPLRVY